MEPTRAVWQTDAVRAAVESGDLGTIVRAVREAQQLTLKQVAERCGYSVSTLSRLERGKQRLADIEVLRLLATALGIPGRMLGVVDTPARSVQGRRPAARVGVVLAPDEEIDPMRRRTLLAGLTGLAGTAVLGPSSLGQAPDPMIALESSLLSAPTGGVPVELPRLTRGIAQMRAVFQQGRYGEVAAALPGLRSTAIATHAEATTTEAMAAANGQLAELYMLVSELMIKLGRDELAWTTADRAVQAAYGSGDVLTQATAGRAWAIVLRRAGRAEQAQRLVVEAAAALQPELGRGPEHLSVYGSLLSTAAYTAAVDGDRGTAQTLIGEAVDAADRLGTDANHRFTAFGPTGVGLYRISIARVLGDAGSAIDAAKQIRPAAIPVVERRARYWSDVARSFYQWDKPEKCYRALLAAEQASPDEVRYRKPVQQITTCLLRNPATQSLPGLQAFAHRTGANH